MARACRIAAVVAAAAALLAAQTPTKSTAHSDLQGIWTNMTVTSLERPRELGEKQFFTKEEAAEYEKKFIERNDRDRRDGGAEADVARAYNEAWFDRGTKVVPSLRTSLVVDPSSGRIPALTAQALKAESDRAERLRRSPNGPEDRLLRERCILGENAGPPMLPTIYNNNFQIFQTAGYVAIFSEMIHDVRMIPIDADARTPRPHLPGGVRQWLGDSRGHWEGKTLVVDSTNFTSENPIRGSDENMHLVERFTRVQPDMILYQFAVDDPTAFTKPWSAEIPMTATKGPLYEYACHEGNYGMAGLLAGARAEEKKAAAEAAKKSAK